MINNLFEEWRVREEEREGEAGGGEGLTRCRGRGSK